MSRSSVLLSWQDELPLQKSHLCGGWLVGKQRPLWSVTFEGFCPGMSISELPRATIKLFLQVRALSSGGSAGSDDGAGSSGVGAPGDICRGFPDISSSPFFALLPSRGRTSLFTVLHLFQNLCLWRADTNTQPLIVFRGAGHPKEGHPEAVQPDSCHHLVLRPPLAVAMQRRATRGQ